MQEESHTSMPEMKEPSNLPDPEAHDLGRRRFLEGMGGVAAGLLGGAAAGVAPFVEGDAWAVELAPLSPVKRHNEAFKIRLDAAKAEKMLPIEPQPTNGDEERFPSRIANFSKTLPHDELGEVDPGAYQALLDAMAAGTFAAVEQIPKAGPQSSRLFNPLGGLAFNLKGPDSRAVAVEPPPTLASPQWAAQMVELYWMAVLRDVPFAEYQDHPLVALAASDLSQLPGYSGPRDPIQQMVTPQTLFRIDFPGVLEGPMVSQFLLRSFGYDAIPVDPMIRTALPGIDFLTRYSEWLEAQRGFPNGAPPFRGPLDDVLRFPRSARDLGHIAGNDLIYSTYFRAAAILLQLFGLLGARDAANPYLMSDRQVGFSSLGLAHMVQLIGEVHQAERGTWYQKWNVHRFLRPEAGGGRVHNRIVANRDYPIHPSLFDSAVLPLVFEQNRQNNLARFGIDEGTFLLSQLFPAGSPTHPSFPAGHAISAGACVTVIKAWFDTDVPFPSPVEPNADGTMLLPYSGPPLTIGGELNKLAHNLSLGRDMSGVHWRADDVAGLLQGEEIAIRTLRNETRTYPEPFEGFMLERFDGTTLVI